VDPKIISAVIDEFIKHLYNYYYTSYSNNYYIQFNHEVYLYGGYYTLRLNYCLWSRHFGPLWWW